MYGRMIAVDESEALLVYFRVGERGAHLNTLNRMVTWKIFGKPPLL
jgi:hypothetical protein